jgi:uncharacterized phage protein (TIGR01671 family)
MIREIKFKSWIIPLKKWADDVTMEFHSYGVAPRIFAFCQGDDLIFSGEDIVVLQYTGLEDSKGVEIYEGDIVQTIYCRAEYGDRDNARKEKVTHPVQMSKDYWFNDATSEVGTLYEWETYHEDIEVIGNIHENPDLLD